MPRPKSTTPAYQFHVSGQAVVRLDHKDFYVGKHGTPESYAKYYALLAEYNANGKKAPGANVASVRMAESDILVKHLVADYRARELPKCQHNSGDHGWRSNLLDLIETKFGEIPADTFGPRKLESVRDVLVTRGNCRSYVNKQVRFVIRVFRYGVARELAPASIITGLECLAPLKYGEARENAKRQPADMEAVRKTLPHLCDAVAAMVRIQLATAMRPSELFRMRPCDIDRSGEVWFYRPVIHKTSHHGKAKSGPILGDALEALAPYLFGDAEEPCFQTSKDTTGNKNNYRRHIARACEKVGVSGSFSPRYDGALGEGQRIQSGHRSGNLKKPSRM
ncbi:MAG: site-specific integrase [Rubripirellula sp.]|nr:site-specific integrase [Rubripirellula sp.]